MKNEMKIINTYIDNVCKGIRDRKVKNELKDELLSHLLEVYDKNIALGMTDEDAQKDAVAHMGDSEAVSKTFKQIYPISSAEYFKDTGRWFAWGLVFCMLWSYRGFIGLFALSIYLILSLNRIKIINKRLHTAYNISKVNSILNLIFFFAYHNTLINENVMIAVVICLNIITIVTYIFTIIGLVRVRKDLGEEKTYKGLALSSVLSIILCFTMICIQLFVKHNLGLIFTSLAISILPAGFMYTIVTEDIDKLGTGVPQDKKTKIERYIFALVFGVVGISLFFTSEIFTYYQPIDYVVNDVDTDVNEIRNKLVNLGLPENVANELPESEIVKYKNATELQVDSLPEDTYS